MKTWPKWLTIVAFASLLSACGYNDFQAQDENVKAAWGEVVNQYQRRADLIPNLVNTVKGYALPPKCWKTRKHSINSSRCKVSCRRPCHA